MGDMKKKNRVRQVSWLITERVFSDVESLAESNRRSTSDMADCVLRRGLSYPEEEQFPIKDNES